jgi:hypothetical protein
MVKTCLAGKFVWSYVQMAEIAAGEQMSVDDETHESEGFRQAFFSRKLSDIEKVRYITELESYTALWMTSAVVTRAQKTIALNVLHSLRSSMVREIHRESEDKDYIKVPGSFINV